MRILICGLPGSGKTTTAKRLVEELTQEESLSVVLFNADEIRKQYDDWDFSPEGRHRQMLRMKNLSLEAERNNTIAICDFVCPTKELRKEFDADIVIWMDTIDSGRFEDTNNVFERLDESEYDFVFKDWVEYPDIY